MQHEVTIRCGGKEVSHWTRYRVVCDMLSPADEFDLELAPLTKTHYDLFELDAEVEVLLDGTRILSGFIEERACRGSRQGNTLAITGRDRGGRLVDESMPLTTFESLVDLERLVEAVVTPWFSAVVFSNAANRNLVRGRAARKATAFAEPTPIFARDKAPKKVEPGETRWAVLSAWLEPARLLGWAAADGKTFVVGLPNYSQEIQYSFFAPADRSKRAAHGNVEWELVESTADRYSEITVCGSSPGDARNYGARVTGHRGVATSSATWPHAKSLILSDDAVKNAADAKDRAEREMSVRDKAAQVIKLSVDGHGQASRKGAPPTLYAFDTLAHVELEEIGLDGDYLIVSAEYSLERGQGERTALTLVPRGTTLTL